MQSITTLVLLMVSTVTSLAQQSIFISQGSAIHGYDPVAYFTASKAVKGSPEFSFQWKAATWYFSSQKNLDSFKADPEKYAPQYGGYCAYGASNGYKAPTEPEAWSIVNGKLYLNYNVEVRKDWIAEQEERIKRADEYWEGLRKRD